MKRVNFLCLVLLGLFFTACHSNDDTWGDWSRSFSFGGFPRTGAVTFTIDDVVYVGLGFNILLDQQDKTLSDFWMYKDRIWTQIADFPGEGRYGAVAVVVDCKACYLFHIYYPFLIVIGYICKADVHINIALNSVNLA